MAHPEEPDASIRRHAVDAVEGLFDRWQAANHDPAELIDLRLLTVIRRASLSFLFPGADAARIPVWNQLPLLFCPPAWPWSRVVCQSGDSVGIRLDAPGAPDMPSAAPLAAGPAAAKVRVRPFRDPDDEACLRIENRALPMTAHRPGFARRLIGAGSSRYEWVATLDDQVIGFLSRVGTLPGINAATLTLSVDHDFRGLGAGRALAEVLAGLREFDLLNIDHASAEVDPDDARSVTFAGRYGFQAAIETRPHDYRHDLATIPHVEVPVGISIEVLPPERITPSLLLDIKWLT
ncbi:MAG TPA: GNAT family N-acetyltransferase, partial [Candidatus Nitrosotalea sp.]|nr:GNAT family N-acetyltransferase [Candidatus Nitrosotalea sp.]